MADEKTVFQTGTTVSAEWLNSHYVTNGGHKHDGGDGDGHAGKINLEAHVAGRLPAANLGDHAHNGATISKINPANDILGAEEGAFIINSFYGFTEYQAISVSYKVAGQIGANPKMVTLNWPQLLAESNSTRLQTGDGELPAALRPITGDIYIPCIVTSKGTRKSGFIQIETDGQIIFWAGDDYEGFDNTGIKGFDAFTIVYPIYPA